MDKNERLNQAGQTVCEGKHLCHVEELVPKNSSKVSLEGKHVCKESHYSGHPHYYGIYMYGYATLRASYIAAWVVYLLAGLAIGVAVYMYR